MSKRNLGDLEERFWAKVAVKSSDQYWEWKAYKDRKGYGQFRITPGKLVYAHRFAYEASQMGFISKDLFVLHKCDNPGCCNPMHLYEGTPLDNMRDMDARGRRVKYSATRAFSHADFYAGEIWLIRKLKIYVHLSLSGWCRYKYSLEFVGKMFGTSVVTISKIWNSDRYPCKEGYYA